MLRSTAWPANRSSFADSISPLPPRLRRATSACTHERRLVGLSRFELLTPRLSSVCSNQLSYRPSSRSPAVRPQGPAALAHRFTVQRTGLDAPIPSKLDRTCRTNPEYQIDLERPRHPPPHRSACAARQTVSRKEVIQPQVLLQLPCYDFTPITNHTLGACLPCGLAQRLLVQPAFVM